MFLVPEATPKAEKAPTQHERPRRRQRPRGQTPTPPSVRRRRSRGPCQQRPLRPRRREERRPEPTPTQKETPLCAPNACTAPAKSAMALPTTRQRWYQVARCPRNPVSRVCRGWSLISESHPDIESSSCRCSSPLLWRPVLFLCPFSLLCPWPVRRRAPVPIYHRRGIRDFARIHGAPTAAHLLKVVPDGRLYLRGRELPVGVQHQVAFQRYRANVRHDCPFRTGGPCLSS